MTMCIWCDRFMNWGGQVTLLPDKRYQKAFRLKNEQLHKAGVCHRNIIAPINWHYSFTPLIICNCYYCSTCPALKWCILLGRSGLFIRRNGEIELKMPNEAGRWNYLMWQSFFKEFTFFFLSLPRMCEQGSKQTLSPSFTGKEQEVRNTVTTERQLEYRNTLLDQIFKSKVSFLDVGGYFWPTERCSSEQRGEKKERYIRKIYHQCSFRNPKSCQVVLD